MIDTQQATGSSSSHNPYLPINQVPRDMNLGTFEDWCNFTVFNALGNFARKIRAGDYTFGDLGVVEAECTSRAAAIAAGSRLPWPMMDYDALQPESTIAARLPAQTTRSDSTPDVSAWATITAAPNTVTGILDLADTQVMPAVTA